MLKSICIRRTKNQKVNGKPICELPPKHITEVVLELSKEEREKYDSLANRAKSIYLNYVKDGTVVRNFKFEEKLISKLSNYAHLLEILLRLRQACTHPCLVKEFTESTPSSLHVSWSISKAVNKLGQGNDCEIVRIAWKL